MKNRFEKLKYKFLTAEDAKKHSDDIERLMSLVLRENFYQNYPLELPRQYTDKLPGYIRDGSAAVVGVFDDKKLIAFLWAYELNVFDERRFHIDMVSVDKSYQRLGVAGTMLQMQKEEAVRRGIKILEAMTTWSNEGSYRWFHKYGFNDERVKLKFILD